MAGGCGVGAGEKILLFLMEELLTVEFGPRETVLCEDGFPSVPACTHTRPTISEGVCVGSWEKTDAQSK